MPRLPVLCPRCGFGNADPIFVFVRNQCQACGYSPLSAPSRGLVSGNLALVAAIFAAFCAVSPLLAFGLPGGAAVAFSGRVLHETWSKTDLESQSRRRGHLFMLSALYVASIAAGVMAISSAKSGSSGLKAMTWVIGFASWGPDLFGAAHVAVNGLVAWGCVSAWAYTHYLSPKALARMAAIQQAHDRRTTPRDDPGGPTTPAEVAAQTLALPERIVEPLPDGRTPWERRAELGSWRAIYRTLKGTLVEPIHFFGSMRYDRADGAILYWLAITAPPALVGWLWTTAALTGGEASAAWDQASALTGPLPGRHTIQLAALAAGAPVVFLGPVHLGLRLTGRATGGWTATWKALVYGSAPMALAILPWATRLLPLLSLSTMTLMAIGLSRAHRTSVGAAAAILVATPFAIALLLPVLIAPVLGAAWILATMIFARN